jgi:hypothetical protein
MADFGFTPELVAGGDINPFRMVVLSGAFTGTQAGATAKKIIGVTDGSVRRFDATLNAITGDQISLQPSFTVQVEAGGAITAGAYLTSDADGKAVASTTAGTEAPYLALEAAAAAGVIIRAFRVGSVTI